MPGKGKLMLPKQQLAVLRLGLKGWISFMSLHGMLACKNDTGIMSRLDSETRRSILSRD